MGRVPRAPTSLHCWHNVDEAPALWPVLLLLLKHSWHLRPSTHCWVCGSGRISNHAVLVLK